MKRIESLLVVEIVAGREHDTTGCDSSHQGAQQSAKVRAYVYVSADDE